jgi:hypothetical protein
MNDNDRLFLDCAFACFIEAMAEGMHHDSAYVKKKMYALFLGSVKQNDMAAV